jgi:hypothetical protein
MNRVRGWIGLDRVMIDRITSFEEGMRHERTVPHRFADYFVRIELLLSEEDPASFRIVFQKRPDAARFWKDLMVNVIQEIARSDEAPRITIDYKSDEMPTHALSAPQIA